MSAARWKSSKPQASWGTDTVTSGGYPANRYRVITFDMVSYDRFTISRALRSTDSSLSPTPDTSRPVSEPTEVSGRGSPAIGSLAEDAASRSRRLTGPLGTLRTWAARLDSSPPD